jgi:hypothetical protein
MQRLAREFTPEAARYLIRTTRIWDVATGRDIAVLRGYDGFVKLEPEAWRRGHDYDEPAVNKGRIVSDKDGNPLLVKKYGDTLLVTLLKAHPPRNRRRIATQPRSATRTASHVRSTTPASVIDKLDQIAARKEAKE